MKNNDKLRRLLLVQFLAFRRSKGFGEMSEEEMQQKCEDIDDIAEHWLLAANSTNRGGELVKILQAVPDPEFKNRLLKISFPQCEALRPWLSELRSEFLKAGFVSDSDTPLNLPVKVYRAAWEDDDLDAALSWTTDIEVAKVIAQMCNSDRGQVLGMHREVAHMMIYTGICTDALGYFTARGESEVIAQRVENIEATKVVWKSQADLDGL